MKPTFFLLLLLLQIPFYGDAQSTHKQEKQLNRKREALILATTVQGLDTLSSIPITYVKGLVLIHVSIDGKDRVFLFDSGAMTSVVSPEVAGKDTGLLNISISDGSRQQIEEKLIQKDFVLGHTTFKDVACVIFDMHSFWAFSCVKLDGILGANVIKCCNWKIDPEQQILEYSKTAFKPESGSIPLHFELYNKLLPLVNLSFDKKPIWALLDLGYNGTLQLNDTLYSEYFQGKKAAPNWGYGDWDLSVDGKSKQKVRVTILDSLYIDKMPFKNIPVTINDYKDMVGAQFVFNYITILNWEEKKLYLQPKKEGAPSQLQLSEKDFGLKFEPDDNRQGLKVGFIWNGSPAQKAGITYGDKILRMNGQSVDSLSEDQFCALKQKVTSLPQLKILIEKTDQKQVEATLEKFNPYQKY